MLHEEGWFNADDGTILFRQEWIPDQPAGTAVFLVHGFGDHSGRYGEMAATLTGAGFGVYAFDLRGHGRSPGPRGHILRWDQYRDDLACFIESVGPRITGSPALLGHSMGGLIALEYLISPELDTCVTRGRRRSSIRRAVLSAPLLEEPRVAWWRLKAAAFLSRVWPGFSLKAGIDPATLSRSREEQDDYCRDPLVHGIGSARLAAEITRAEARVRENLHRLGTPLMVCHGDADRLVPVEGSRRLAAAASPGAVVLKEYSGGCHELHNDLVSAQYFGDLLEWLAGTGRE